MRVLDETKGINTDPITARWLNPITKKATRYAYTNAMRGFLKFTGQTPKQLIQEALDDFKRDPMSKTDAVTNRIIAFYNHLKNERKMADLSAESMVTAIRSFYTVYGINVRLRGRTSLPKSRVQNKRLIIGAEQVKVLLEYTTTIRDRAAILMMFQGGLDVSTLCSLRYGEVSSVLERNETPAKIEPQRVKTGVEFYTFIGRSALDALKAYIKELQLRGVKFGKDTPLFQKEQIINGSCELTPQLVQIMMKELSSKAGFVDRKGYNILAPHALRESFGSIMINAGVPDSVVDLWLGHTIGDLDRAYKTVQFESVKKMYADRERLLDPYAALGNGELRKKIDEEVDKHTKETKEKLGYLVGKNMETDERIRLLAAENDRMRGGLQDVVAEVRELKGLIEAMQKRN